MPPANGSKSSPKLVRPTDGSPKRSTLNESINTDRLKLAKDEAERAMKVENDEPLNHLSTTSYRNTKYSPSSVLILHYANLSDGYYPHDSDAVRRTSLSHFSCSRGWIEKFYRGNGSQSIRGSKKSDRRANKSDDDDDDDNDDDLVDDDLGQLPGYGRDSISVALPRRTSILRGRE